MWVLQLVCEKTDHQERFLCYFYAVSILRYESDFTILFTTMTVQLPSLRRSTTSTSMLQIQERPASKLTSSIYFKSAKDIETDAPGRSAVYFVVRNTEYDGGNIIRFDGVDSASGRSSSGPLFSTIPS